MTFWETALAVAVGILMAEFVTLLLWGLLNIFSDILD